MSLRAGKHTILIVEPHPHSEGDRRLSGGAVQLHLQDAGVKDEERDLAGPTCLAATAAPPPTRQATEPLFERDPNQEKHELSSNSIEVLQGQKRLVLLIPRLSRELLDGGTADKWLQNPGRSRGLAVSPTPSPIFHIFCFPIANCYPCHWFYRLLNTQLV